MINQRIKDLYYLSAGKLSVLSLWRYKFLPLAIHFQGALTHLCCGTKYIPGMINVDANPFRKKDMWLDITLGLPFRNNSIQGIYISHSLEHFDGKMVRRLLSEFHRVLRPEGGLRIVVPSLEYAIEAYITKKPMRFSDFPEKYQSLGGKFCNFMLCENQHLMMFDLSLLEELLTSAGFQGISLEGSRKSRYFEKNYIPFEPEDPADSASLYVECHK